MDTKLLINGEIVDGGGDAVAGSIPPQVLRLSVSGKPRRNRLMRLSRNHEAFAAFAARTPGDRAGLMYDLANRMEAEVEAFAVLESLDTGKPIEAAREEMGACVDIFRYMAGAVRCMSGIAAGEYGRLHVDDPP